LLALSVLQMNTFRLGFCKSPQNAIGRSSPRDRRRRHAPKIELHPPEQLENYLTGLSKLYDHKREQELGKKWLNYWVDAGKGREALTAFRILAADEDRRRLVQASLDTIHEFSFRLEGKTEAYSWLMPRSNRGDCQLLGSDRFRPT